MEEDCRSYFEKMKQNANSNYKKHMIYAGECVVLKKFDIYVKNKKMHLKIFMKKHHLQLKKLKEKCDYINNQHFKTVEVSCLKNLKIHQSVAFKIVFKMLFNFYSLHYF